MQTYMEIETAPLEDLRVKLGLESREQVVRYAISLMKLVADEEKRGGKVYIERRIPHRDQQLSRLRITKD